MHSRMKEKLGKDEPKPLYLYLYGSMRKTPPPLNFTTIFEVLPEISAENCPEPPPKPFSGGFWGLLGKNILILTHFGVFLRVFGLFLLPTPEQIDT